jgi:hypothetical protein
VKISQISKSEKITFIVVGLLLAVALTGGIFLTSWNQIAKQRTEAIVSSLSGADGKKLASDAAGYMTEASETIVDESDQVLWTKGKVRYRTGPGKSYETKGLLGKYASVDSTATTLNGWKRVTIDETEYYISADYLTPDPPVTLDGGQKGEYERYAMSLFPDYGWEITEITPLIKLWNRESGWNPHSHNKRSGAHGIPQALPASKMASYGSDYYSNGYTQIRLGLRYIAGRYGSPSAACAHFSSSGWY